MASDDDTLLGPVLGDTDTMAAESAPKATDAVVSAEALALPDRYEHGERLGAGGMGEVRSAFDRRVGRQVAVKVTHDAQGTLGNERFLREARVQGQLEHPSVVPVYDLGHMPDGRPYFTMKVLHGEDLAQVLERLRAADEATHAKFGRRRLLGFFVDVCQAIAYTHQQGVIHRDLKPSNVMVGDFGEVYVLDWGIAKLGNETEAPATSGLPILESDQTPKTEAGSLLGTPGYMAPEQYGTAQVTAAADIYALGVLLFELLYFTPLHHAPSAMGRMATTLDPIDWDERLRAVEHEAPPELVQVCERATALDPGDRYPSVSALLGAVEAYLEGDRDLALRRDLTDRHVAQARAQLAAGSQPQALRELGRAIALDPAHPEALALMRQAFVAKPAEPPPEVTQRLRADQLASRRLQTLQGSRDYLIWAVLTAAALVGMGVRQPWVVGSILALLVFQAAATYAFYRTGSERLFVVHAITQGLLFLGLARIYGPLVMMPVLAVTVCNAILLHPMGRRETLGVTALGLSAIVVPWLLERLGVLSPSYRFDGQTMTILPNAVDLSPLGAEAFLLIVGTGLVLNGCMVAARVRHIMQAAQQDAYLRAWQLEQLVPAAAE